MKKWLLAVGALAVGAMAYAFSSVTEWAKAVVSSQGIGLWPGASGQPAYINQVGGNGEAEHILGPPDGKAAVIYGAAGNYIIVEVSSKPRNSSQLAVHFMWLEPDRQEPMSQQLRAQVSADAVEWEEVPLDAAELQSPSSNLVRRAPIPGLPVRYVKLYQLGGVSAAIDAVSVSMRRL